MAALELDIFKSYYGNHNQDSQILVETSARLDGIEPDKTETVRTGKFGQTGKRYYYLFRNKIEFSDYIRYYKLRDVTGFSHLPPDIKVL